MQIGRLFYYGDSYCASSDEGSYQDILEKDGHQAMRLGKRGSGPLEMFSFLQDHNVLYDSLENDYAVIMYSAYDRQIDKSGFSMPNVNSINEIMDPFISQDYIKALQGYYKHLFNEQQWLTMFDATVLATRAFCMANNIKFIEFCCFEFEAKRTKMDFSLHKWTAEGYEQTKKDGFDDEAIQKFQNHMSPEQNKVFANLIIEKITKKYGGGEQTEPQKLTDLHYGADRWDNEVK